MMNTTKAGKRFGRGQPRTGWGVRRARRAPAVLFAVLPLAAAAFSGDARAGDYPNAPITVIVPTSAGGGMDLMARVVSMKMGQLLKTSFVVENVPGANGIIGAVRVANAAPDGYTILLGQTSQMVINPYLYSNVSYDTFKSFAPVVRLSNAPNVVVVPRQSPFQSLADIVAAARKANAQGKSLNLATPGSGTVSHLTSVLFQQAAHIQLSHIPYKGANSAITDTIAGRDDLMMSSIPTSFGQIKAGQLRAVAVSADKRSTSLPEVPTIAEAGYPGFNAGTWYGFFVPAKTPQAVVDLLNKVANEALQSPDVVKTIQSDGGDVIGGSSKDFLAVLTEDAAKWSKAVKESGAKVD
ncbi:LacI family transcriptional regulator [Achromobacter sp. HZ28]|nr:LacI family transcriptional regulator [Achromobacter sp. HZ34]OWT79488.1 LacI family transcriptional regulator [Achromobacter sp. HZ28]